MSYLPTVLQVKQLVDTLHRQGEFALIDTLEILERHWHVAELSIRPEHRMVAHTGFLTVARKGARISPRMRHTPEVTAAAPSWTTNRRQSWMRPRSATPRTGGIAGPLWQLCSLAHGSPRHASSRWLPLCGLNLPQPPGSNDPLTEADQLLGFAEALFHDGDYFRAITEYKRFLFLYPADARAGRVQLQIGLLVSAWAAMGRCPQDL